MSKDPLENWLYNEAADFMAASVVRKIEKISPLVEQAAVETFSDFPSRLARWIGKDGTEDSPIPNSSNRYLPLTETYRKAKERLWKKRGKTLGSRQAFYSLTGELRSSLLRRRFPKGELCRAVSVKASFEGSGWFDTYQRNYSALKSRLRKRIRASKPTSTELSYRITANVKLLHTLLVNKIGTDNALKLELNDSDRPLITPAIKYVLRREFAPKLNKILKGL